MAATNFCLQIVCLGILLLSMFLQDPVSPLKKKPSLQSMDPTTEDGNAISFDE